MKTKLIYDVIHGYIEFNPLLLSIIDTPEFQRLRNIKQLGACHFIFPSATHTRFQHSLGVAYLSRVMIENIKQNNPELQISQDTIENIEIAGLCHDLGHGPFSHLFDDLLLNDSNDPNKFHEVRSCNLFEKLVKDNQIDITPDRIAIIQELIHPQNKKELNIPDYIYQIVANNFNSIDVDKFDYLRRDCYTLGLSYSFDFNRIIKQAKVIHNHICFPEKIYNIIYQIFITRWRLHTEIYNHPIVRCIEWMLADCFISAEKIIKMKEKIASMEYFYQLDDSILQIIEFMDDIELNNSKHILQRIKKRDLYQYIGEIKIDNYDENQLQLVNINKVNHPIQDKDIIIDIVKIGYLEDPLKNVYFYNLSDPEKYFTIDKKNKTNLIPNNFSDVVIRFYSRNKEKTSYIKQLYDELLAEGI